MMKHTTYIRRETAVSVVINSVLSALFFWLVFGGLASAVPPSVQIWHSLESGDHMQMHHRL